MEIIRLKVKSGRHYKGGVKYSPGDEFDGTRAELNAFSDKLVEVVTQSFAGKNPVYESEESTEKGKVDDSQIKVSIPSRKKKRGRPPKLEVSTNE